MKYKLVIKESSQVEAEGYIWDHLDPEHTSVEDITIIGRWHNMAATILSDSHDSTITYALNMWMNENRFNPPFPVGALLWWTRFEEEDTEEEEEAFMREENLGPVLNPDGTPSDLTKEMLEGTGRSLYPPFGPVTVITAEGIGQGMLHADDHLEMSYEDRNGPAYDESNEESVHDYDDMG